jgi:predicted ATP-dependent endonuclease of OLD family
MRLLSVRVTDFKSINDATEVAIDPQVTCLVGKNESGKTAFLEALFKRLNSLPTQ